MAENVLPRDFTAEEMDRGEGMTFHPCSLTRNRRRMEDFQYDFENKIHFFTSNWLGSVGRYDRPRIGTGQDCKAGEPFPDHWVQDPWTGETLD